MRKIVLFIASSLDGFIAGPNDSIDWLYTDQDYNYTPFITSVDTTLMGHKTLETMLKFEGEYYYKGLTNYVFTRNTEGKSHPHVQFISEDPAQFTKKLLQEPGKDIFLVGGGEINAILLNAELIDKMVVSIHPFVVGNGSRLFSSDAHISKFKTVHTEAFDSGLVQITLEKEQQ